MPELPTSSGRRPAHVAPVDTPESSQLLALAVAITVIAGLYFGRSVLIPIVLSVLLSFLLTPVANLLRRAYIPRVVSVLLAVLLSLCVILAAGGLIAIQVADLAQQVPRYSYTIQQKIETVQ